MNQQPNRATPEGCECRLGDRVGTVGRVLPLYEGRDEHDFMVDVRWRDGAYSWERVADLTLFAMSEDEFDARVAVCVAAQNAFQRTPRWRPIRRRRLREVWLVETSRLALEVIIDEEATT